MYIPKGGRRYVNASVPRLEVRRYPAAHYNAHAKHLMSEQPTDRSEIGHNTRHSGRHVYVCTTDKSKRAARLIARRARGCKLTTYAATRSYAATHEFLRTSEKCYTPRIESRVCLFGGAEDNKLLYCQVPLSHPQSQTSCHRVRLYSKRKSTGLP